MIWPPPLKIASGANVTSIILNLLFRIAARIVNKSPNGEPMQNSAAQSTYIQEMLGGPLTFFTERAFSSCPTKTLSNGVFDRIKKSFIHLSIS